MPFDVTVNRGVQLFGVNYSDPEVVSGNAGIPIDQNIEPAANGSGGAGVLTTRTDNDTGSVTMTDASHGITTAAKVDVYWTGGSRYNMTVGTVAGAVVPIDGGGGDALPVATTALVLKVPEIQAAVAVGDNVVSIGLKGGSVRRTYVIKTGGGAVALAVVLAAQQDFIWTFDSGITNPLGSGVTTGTVCMSHESTTETPNMQGYLLYE